MFKVVDTIVVIDDVFGRRVVVKRIDGETAPCGILGMRAKLVVAQDATMSIRGLRL